ncbi:MAG: hypothetical protein ACYTFV_12435 [Planctomycetota bacterium]
MRLIDGESLESLRPTPEEATTEVETKTPESSTDRTSAARDDGERGGELPGTPGLSPA